MGSTLGPSIEVGVSATFFGAVGSDVNCWGPELGMLELSGQHASLRLFKGPFLLRAPGDPGAI